MTVEAPQTAFTSDFIQEELTHILKDMTADWDLEFTGPIGPETGLISDLGFESIDVVQFIVAIEERFKQRGLPFEDLLMSEGRYVDEIRLSDAVNFLSTHLNNI